MIDSEIERAEPVLHVLPQTGTAQQQEQIDVDRELRFEFTGSGKEYFRIWIVNLCLTFATLGIYSAWAKVRRLQYFARNTQLDGAAFDFHGNPKAILKGRVLAVVLFAVYHYAFGFSKAFGVAVVGFLFLSLPWLLRGALRFRLHNTLYRGLRFAFTGTLPQAYLVYFPMMAAFFLPAALLALYPGNPGRAALSGLLYLVWPLWHARVKRYQQSHLQYGNLRAEYSVSNGEFFARYFFAGLVGMLGAILAGMLVGGASLLFKGQGGVTYILGFAGSLLSIYVSYLFAAPHLQASIYNLTWSNTAFPNGWIESTLKPNAYVQLQAGNAVLTILTLGLYRPFAVVRAYRYRLEHTAVRINASLDKVTAAPRSGAAGASGDSADDFLGFDLSW